MEKLDRVQNAQFWGLKTWGQGGPRPRDPLDLLMQVLPIILSLTN